MSARHLRIALASAMVVFSAAACSSTTGPSDSADLEAVGIAPLSDEHQGSDSIRTIDNAPMQVDEHQGSDS